jgi:protein-tyrosine sulfotransferase
MLYLSELFPNAKFLLMIRDERYVVHSFMQKLNLNITFDLFLKFLEEWNRANIDYEKDCARLGTNRCIKLICDDLVLNLTSSMRRVAQFLNIDWTNDFLHHEKFVEENKIQLAKSNGWSDEQVNKPIYTDALNSKVFEKIDGYNGTLFEKKAPLLRKYGYL